MLYLTDEQMEQARPDMTAKEIREIRKPAKIEQKKPDETERQYLKSAAKHLIICWHVWFLQDFMNRVMQVDISPKEIKRKLEGKSRTVYFSTDKGIGHINLFDDCVQVWNEENNCIGDFDWFYMAAAIQSMWNEVILEKAEKKTKPYDRGCITGKSPSGNCVCCGKGGVECCAQCKEKCNGKCGWLDVAPAQQEPEEQIQGQMEIQDYPEILPEEHIASDSREQQGIVAMAQQEESDQEPFVNPPEIHEETVEIIDPADQEENYEELSDKTDMELLRDLLTGAQNLLKIMNESYTENDVRVRKQKLMIDAYAGMIADLDQEDIPETIQPELPLFKNNDQRKEWLRNYQAWGLW